MMDVSLLNDRQLEDLQNQAYLERVQRIERNKGQAMNGCASSPSVDRDAMKLADCSSRPTTSTAPMRPGLSLHNVVDAFTYHGWDPDQVEAGAQVVEALIAAARVILRVVPDGPDRAVALRKLREARMDANSAITHRGRF